MDYLLGWARGDDCFGDDAGAPAVMAAVGDYDVFFPGGTAGWKEAVSIGPEFADDGEVEKKWPGAFLMLLLAAGWGRDDGRRGTYRIDTFFFCTNAVSQNIRSRNVSSLLQNCTK